MQGMSHPTSNGSEGKPVSNFASCCLNWEWRMEERAVRHPGFFDGSLIRTSGLLPATTEFHFSTNFSRTSTEVNNVNFLGVSGPRQAEPGVRSGTRFAQEPSHYFAKQHCEIHLPIPT